MADQLARRLDHRPESDGYTGQRLSEIADGELCSARQARSAGSARGDRRHDHPTDHDAGLRAAEDLHKPRRSPLIFARALVASGSITVRAGYSPESIAFCETPTVAISGG